MPGTRPMRSNRHADGCRAGKEPRRVRLPNYTLHLRLQVTYLILMPHYLHLPRLGIVAQTPLLPHGQDAPAHVMGNRRPPSRICQARHGGCLNASSNAAASGKKEANLFLTEDSHANSEICGLEKDKLQSWHTPWPCEKAPMAGEVLSSDVHKRHFPLGCRHCVTRDEGLRSWSRSGSSQGS